MTTKQDDMLALEDMVDRHGLYAVAGMLAEVCHEKADHLATNWQDHTAALQDRKSVV